MQSVGELLELAKSVASQAGDRLLSFTEEQRRYVHSRDHAKEIKALADSILEQDILRALAPCGLPILSEESGFIAGQRPTSLRFIVDPLDGTFNFVKDLGPSAVCIALWQQDTPVFGVIHSLWDRELVWGGPDLGAYAGDRPISVSSTPRAAEASLCTGFPVRFNLNDDSMRRFKALVSPYAKVRMLGSAAISLLQVARGRADAYSEQNIMLWDVAAGLAIVQGAGGMCSFQKTSLEWSYDVFASNPYLADPQES